MFLVQKMQVIYLSEDNSKLGKKIEINIISIGYSTITNYMSQLQHYSNNISFYYLFNYWIVMVIKIGFIGILLALLFQKIKNTIQPYIDKINLLENKLVRINENYKSLADNFNQHTHLEDLMWVEINKSHDVLENKINETYDKLKSETNNSYDELKCNMKKHKQIITGLENELFQMNEKIDKMNESICYEDAINEISDTCDKLTSIFNVYKEETNNSYDELKCDVKKHKQIITGLENELFQMNETLAETTCAISEINKTCTHLIEDIDIENKNIKSEISNLNSFTINNSIFIGYKFDYCVRPIFVLSCETMICDYVSCLIINQLKNFKCIRKIDITELYGKMVIFDDTNLKELNELNVQKGSKGSLSDAHHIVDENNTKYFIIITHLIENFSDYPPLLNLDKKFGIYIKNGIKKLHNKLHYLNIELTMTDELYNFVFK